jgi:lipoprotein-anchoring transpeptidase ErfK/SrfK
MNLARAWRPSRFGGRLTFVAAMLVAIAVGTQTASGAARSTSVGPAATALDDTAQVRASAAMLAARYKANPQSLLQSARSALGSGRNDATVAEFLRLRWVSRLNAGLERYGVMLDSENSAQVVLGIAGVQRYSELIHKGLLHDGPGRLVIVSLESQRLTALDHGTPIIDTAVTTGRPTLPTDVGAMHILGKDSPWTMKSPWPKGSPEWYPDTPVQMVVWFTKTGEGMHDASWQPAGTYGPNSQNGPFASHGCIHVPLAAETRLFNWATLGTPVVVYPGDGSPVGVQVRLQSVDAAGMPISGVRGD